MDHSRHAGKVAIVSGAGSGIGRATAVRLAMEGATVLGCDVVDQGLDETLEAIRDAGAEATMAHSDISSQADVDSLVDQASAMGRLHIVANVAGVMDRALPITEMDDAMWDRVIGINLTGTMRMCRAAVPRLVANGGGVIVNIASVAGLVGGAAGAAYTSSKHAVIGLTKSIAFFYGPQGVRANAICPGGVETNIVTSAGPKVPWAEQRMAANAGRSSGRRAQPEEMAALLSWMASDEAVNLNGSIVTSDGGMTAG
jgi:NAD(P)-dependent dehydrogenase (short-subunit alcohol dehydrogenase family)